MPISQVPRSEVHLNGAWVIRCNTRTVKPTSNSRNRGALTPAGRHDAGDIIANFATGTFPLGLHIVPINLPHLKRCISPGKYPFPRAVQTPIQGVLHVVPENRIGGVLWPHVDDHRCGHRHGLSSLGFNGLPPLHCQVVVGSVGGAQPEQPADEFPRIVEVSELEGRVAAFLFGCDTHDCGFLPGGNPLTSGGGLPQGGNGCALHHRLSEHAG